MTKADEVVRGQEGSGKKIERDKRELGGDENVHYADCGDGFMAYICQNLSNSIL